MDFARVYVELDAARGVCNEGKFHKTNGKAYIVKPEYEWMPMHCPNYQVFCHSTSNCQKTKIAPKETGPKAQLQSMEWKQVARGKRRAKSWVMKLEMFNPKVNVLKEV